jgi:hypothetical protein
MDGVRQDVAFNVQSSMFKVQDGLKTKEGE